MNTFEMIMESIDQYELKAKELTDSYKELLKSKDIPLEDRWAIFVKAFNAGVYRVEKTWNVEYQFMNDYAFSWYDDFYIDRYKTVNLVDVAELLEEKWAEEMDSDELEGRLNKVKEEILDKGFSSFIMDW